MYPCEGLKASRPTLLERNRRLVAGQTRRCRFSGGGAPRILFGFLEKYSGGQGFCLPESATMYMQGVSAKSFPYYQSKSRKSKRNLFGKTFFYQPGPKVEKNFSGSPGNQRVPGISENYHESSRSLLGPHFEQCSVIKLFMFCSCSKREVMFSSCSVQ